MTVKRIAAIGDIHAEDELLEGAINFCREQVELIVSVGDIVDGSGDVNRCCALLRENKIPAVRGNHERWLLKNEMRLFADVHYPEDIEKDNLQWLRRLPSTLVFQTVRGSVLLCHGLGENVSVRTCPWFLGAAECGLLGSVSSVGGLTPNRRAAA
jgi:predicted phosphodiesterase